MEGDELEEEYSWKSFYRKSYFSHKLDDDQIMLIREMLKSSTVIKDISYQPLCKSGDNNATEIYAVQILTRFGDLNHYIAKMRSTNDAILDETTDFNKIMLRNEIAIYTKVFVEFYVVQKVYMYHSTSVFETAKFSGILNDESNIIMIIRDFREHGWRHLDQLQPLSNNTVRMVLRHLARLHTFSYTLKEKSPQIFLELCNSLKDTNMFKVLSRHKSGYSVLGHYFSEIFDDIKYKNMIMEAFTKHADSVNNLINYENNSKHSVIIHGDCWVKNILFKLKGNTPIVSTFIDYQLSREASPVADVLHFIFTSTDYKTRSEHYHDWLDFYYTQLQSILWKYDLDQSVYTRSEFDAEIKNYVQFQLGTTIIKLCFLLRGIKESELIKYAISDSEDIEELINSLKSNAVTEETVKIIKDRIEGLINSGREFGHI